MRVWFGFIICALGCCGQSITVSAVGGLRGVDDMGGNGSDGLTSASKRYVVGPSVEVGLAGRFGVEVEALYRREGYELRTPGFIVSSSERGNSWEFPVLIKYRLPVALARPFLEVGYAPRVASTAFAMATTDACKLHPLGCVGQITGMATGNAKVDWPVSHGVVVGEACSLPWGAYKLRQWCGIRGGATSVFRWTGSGRGGRRVIRLTFC